MSLLFIAKEKPLAKEVAEMIKLHIKDAEIIFGHVNDPFPDHILTKEYDYVISYISPWVVPQKVLSNTKKAAINLHPGPPEYPGIGCTNFALYNGERDFGITVHHMEAKVDTGTIIAVKRFPVFENDTVYSLTQRCYAYIYTSFVQIFSLIIENKTLPECGEKWKRKPYKRVELNELCKITEDMSENEIARRIRATTYPNAPEAYMEIKGHRFEYKNNT